jgi:hypothetical protein
MLRPLHGLHQKYNRNGQLIRQCVYVAGKLNGECKEWWENGKLKRVCFYCDNKVLNGEYREWQTDGTPKRQCFIYNNKLYGECKEWWENGKLKRVCFYRDAKLYGEDRRWSITGELHDTNWWINNHKVTQSQFEIISRFVNNLKTKIQISRQFGLTITRFFKCIQSLKSRVFCEWWYSPDGIGGKRTKRLLARLSDKSIL